MSATPPPPPPPPAMPMGGMPEGGATADNSKGTWSLVTGILSFFCCGIVLGIVAIVLGVQGRNAAARGTATNGGMATAGMVLGIIGLVVNTIGSFWYYSNNLTG